MIIRELDIREVRKVYRKYLTADFPPNERKPLAMIERALKRNEYRCLAAFDEDMIQAYAFFVVLPGIHGAGPRYMFDYYAVIKDMRGMGVGSHFIKKLLAEDLGDGSLVLLEIEDPDCARSPEDREICERRRSFYINNGLIDTGVHANTFGVEFILMEAPAFGKHTKCEVGEYYADFYRAFLPPLIFRKMILIREA